MPKIRNLGKDQSLVVMILPDIGQKEDDAET
jgi:hypothetical protein